jgi:hypothetical protein
MKVLDLKCTFGHAFEGWFASEDDFVGQCERSLVLCPVCGDPSVVKQLSAPRLLLSADRAASTKDDEHGHAAPAARGGSALAEAWLALARHVVEHTTDVGAQFADEARKIHYGDRPERGIRGTATPEETRSLLEEGIEILPVPLPAAAKESLH